MHLLVEACVNDCLKDLELLDDNEEAGYLCDDSSHGLPEQIKCMISNWGQQAWVESTRNTHFKPTTRGRYSVPNATRNPDIIQDCRLTNEDPVAMILDPPPGWVVMFLTEPGSLDTW